MSGASNSIAFLVTMSCLSTARGASLEVAVYVEDARSARARVVSVVAKHGELLDERAFASALFAQGKGRAALDAKLPKPAPAEVRELLRGAAQKLGADVAVVVISSPAARNTRALRLLVVETGSGQALFDDAVVFSRAAKRKKKLVWTDDFSTLDRGLDRALARAQKPRPAAKAASPEAKSPETASSVAELPLWARGGEEPASPARVEGEERGSVARPKRREGGRELVSAWVGYDHLARRVVVSSAVSGLRSYALGLGSPGGALGLRVYPMAIAGDESRLADLGLEAEMSRAFFARSALEGSDDSVDTRASAKWLGARFRQGLAAHELGATLGYAERYFVLEGVSGLTDLLPSTDYRFLRAGLDATLRASAFAVLCDAALLWPFRRGAVLDAALPEASGLGFTASLGARVPLFFGIDAFGKGRFTQIKTSAEGGGAVTEQVFEALAGVSYAVE